MKSLLIRNVPDHTAAALRRLAKARNHSLQKELLELLEAAAREASEETHRERFSLKFAASGESRPFQRADIYDDGGDR
ncbi:MAG: hypothetical protein KA004_13730 [Verrucomicrobiales bacterium]|nr:hypothetical protein [Verrucomicrobiales bacterium]